MKGSTGGPSIMRPLETWTNVDIIWNSDMTSCRHVMLSVRWSFDTDIIAGWQEGHQRREIKTKCSAEGQGFDQFRCSDPHW